MGIGNNLFCHFNEKSLDNCKFFRFENLAYINYCKHYPNSSLKLKEILIELNKKSPSLFITTSNNNNNNNGHNNNSALNLFKSLHYDSRESILGLLNPQPDKRLTLINY